MPVQQWEDTDTRYQDNVVWWSRLDNQYLIEIIQDEDDGYTGTFFMYDHNNDNELVKEEKVGLAFGARFGPDVSDVMEWQELGIKIANERKEN